MIEVTLVFGYLRLNHFTSPRSSLIQENKPGMHDPARVKSDEKWILRVGADPAPDRTKALGLF
jgi:hypothetical protein